MCSSFHGHSIHNKSYVSYEFWVLNPHSPSAWDSLIDEGWQSLIMLSGTDYDPTCFLLAHIHVTLLMNYNSTQRVTQWGPLSFRLHAMPCTVHWTMMAHLSTVIICSDFVVNNLTLEAWWARCTVQFAEIVHTQTVDAFLFLYDVWTCEEKGWELQTSN